MNPYKVIAKAMRVIGWVLFVLIYAIPFVFLVVMGIISVGWWFPVIFVAALAGIVAFWFIVLLCGSASRKIARKWREKAWEWDEKKS